MNQISRRILKYRLLVGCITVGAGCVAAGAIVLALDSSEGTMFAVSIAGMGLGFPSVWLLHSALRVLGDDLLLNATIRFPHILAVGVMINWLCVGVVAETVRSLFQRRRRK